MYMKKSVVSVLISISIFTVFSVKNVSAKVLTNPQGNVQVAEHEIINDDLFAGGQTVNIDGTVNGDVFVGGQTVKITGPINGNLHVGANTIYLGGRVKGNVYAGGQSVLVNSGTIDGSLLAGGATVNIDKNSAIGGSVLAGAGSLSVDSSVRRNVFAGTGSLTIGDNAKIGKDLYYATGDKIKEVNISKMAHIAGAVHKNEIKTKSPPRKMEFNKQQAVAAYSGFKLFATVVSFLAALIVGYIYLTFFTTDFSKTAELVEKSFWKSLGIGFLVTIALIPGLLFLLITIIGIPLAGLVLALLALYSYLVKIVVGKVFGGWMAKKFNWKLSPYWTFVVGLGGITILEMIPVLGCVTGLAVFWSGLGAYGRRFFVKK